MDVVSSNFLPGDPRLVDQIVYELKSQGIFDQFRKECIADVDTKPAYQNLSQRVEGSVMNFLNKQTFSEDINKNQLREQLRKNITESGFLDSGVERIVDQVVNPKINTVFLPKVEDVVYRFLGIKKPNQEGQLQEVKPAKVEDLLPVDLEAVSPESVHDQSLNSSAEKKEEVVETNDNSLNTSDSKTEDESPPFELLEENVKFALHEENSHDSHLSGISGLADQDSIHSTDLKTSSQMEISQDISQNSMNSDGNLSIITSEEDTKMEICEDTAMSEGSDKPEIATEKTREDTKETSQQEDKVDATSVDLKNIIEERSKEKMDMINNVKETASELEDDKKVEERKSEKIETDSRKTRDKRKSSRSNKERKEDRDKKSRTKSESKSKNHKDKSSTKHNSSSKEKDRDKKEYTNGEAEILEKDKISKKDNKDRDRSKDKTNTKNKDIKEKSDKSRERSEKSKDKPDKNKPDKDKSDKDKLEKDKLSKDKERIEKEKTKDRPNKEKSDKERDKSNKDTKSEDDKHKSRERDKSEKNKSEKDKHGRDRSSSSKHVKEKSSGSSKKDSSEKDKVSKDKGSSAKEKTSSSSKHKESSSKDKDPSKSSKDKDKSKLSTSISKDKEKEKSKDKKGGGHVKSKTSDKHKKSEKDRSSSRSKSSSSKKDKDKKVSDDHYSLKDKKNDRRSTDRDSNDGSSKMSRNNSFAETYSNSLKGSSKESSEVFSSGGGDSSNSDTVEGTTMEDRIDNGGVNFLNIGAASPIKYIKPKFASNIHEAMKIMKIRKQLAKLERQNQLALANVPMVNDNRVEQNIIGTKEKGKSPKKTRSPKLEKRDREQETVVHIDSKTKPQTTQKILKTSPKKNGKQIRDPEIRQQETNTSTLEEETPLLKSQDLSMENFEALEARLAQEMSNINYYMYGDEDDNYEYSSITISPAKKRKTDKLETTEITKNKTLFQESAIKRCDAENAKENKESNVADSIFVDSDVSFEQNSSLISNVDSRATCEAEKLLEKSSLISSQIKRIDFGDSTDDSNNEIELVAQQFNVPNDEILSKTYENEAGSDILIIDSIEQDDQEVIEEQVTEDTLILNNENEDLDSLECQSEEEIVETTEESVAEEICSHETEVFQENTEAEIGEISEEFRGFTTDDKDSSFLININKLMNKINLDIDKVKMKNCQYKLTKLQDQKGATQPDISEYSPSLPLKVGSKEIEQVVSIRDLLQKNGNKLFIQIDKLNIELTPKVLVTLQDMGLNEVTKKSIDGSCEIICGVKEGKGAKGILNAILHGQQVEIKKPNGQLTNDQSVSDKRALPSLNTKTLIGKPGREVKWENDESPCYYFDKSDTVSDSQLTILNGIIGRLEKSIEEQSLNIQNNIPKPKKRGRKRKIHGTENNNSIGCDFKPERKRRFLSDANSNQNGDSVCNTDVSSQGFNLPLSPAESDKSGEHKKEEPVTVKTKRSGRGSATKRYSSEDLYKPRPLLSCSSKRSRSTRSDDRRS